VLGLIALFCGALLAGCEGSVTVDMSTEPAARRDIQQVVVNIIGVEFRKSSGDTARLEFRDSTPFDLLNSVSASPLRLFTDEQLPDGTYTGLRLLLDAEDVGRVVVSAGGQFQLLYAAGNFANVNFTVDKDKSTKESLVVTMDLRQSLSFNDNTNDYTLTPVLRAVRSEDGGQISGTVTVSCPANTSLANGGAVYLFQGEDVTADDIDGAAAEPFATTVVTSVIGAAASYTLRFLPQGNYTVAATCRGNEEDPKKNDDLGFRGTDSVALDEAESLQLNLTN
jgi:hypothetical protein